jgi:hypothetical protein
MINSIYTSKRISLNTTVTVVGYIIIFSTNILFQNQCTRTCAWIHSVSDNITDAAPTGIVAAKNDCCANVALWMQT